MKLKFYLLWLEDHIDLMPDEKDSIRKIIEGHEFELVGPDICENIDEFEKYRDNIKKYDMILVDYKLAERKSGAEFIKTIRENKCLTIVLFYSEAPEESLRKEVSEKNLDGVFCIHRDDLIDRFEEIFINNIKKIEDVNNLRGLVMAETSELEKEKEKIIKLYELADCKEKERIRKEVIESLEYANNCNKKKLEDIGSDAPFKKILELRNLFTLDRKSRLIDKINSRPESNKSDFNHQDFIEKIIQPRNKLAHEPEKEENGKIFFGEGDKKTEFSQEYAKKMRKHISEYKAILKKLKSIVEKEKK